MRGRYHLGAAGAVLAAALLLAATMAPAPPARAAHDTLINPASGEGGAYPQNPTEEYQAEQGGYLISYSSFQYRESDGRWWVKAVVTIKNKADGSPYQGPLTVRVIRDSLTDSGEVLERAFDEPFENRYLTFAKFGAEGHFRLMVSFPAGDGGGELSAEFPLTVGEPGSPLVLVGAAALLAAAVVAVVVLKRRKGGDDAVTVPAG
ncbi:MAG TPA: hypothetical protein ENJ37_05985 [Deltaproteobacteria bacterium]|nr:hypothetical protein [Deltaproteobacteria bacterium]